MSKELVISSNRHETKVAVLEEDQLVEVYFQRSNEYSLAGSIHKGRVTRVLPGMQSAFVDLGLERDTFLYVSDFLEEHEDFDKVTGDERSVAEARPRESRGRDDRPRGDRGRNARGRGDDRSRDDHAKNDQRRGQPRPAAGAQAAPVTGGSARGEATGEAAAEGAPAVLSSSEAGGAESAAATVSGGQEQRDRHGRRRRRRKGARGFPDAKYGAPQAAGAPGTAAEAGVETEEEAGPEAVVETHAAEPIGKSSSIVQPAPIVLPGESLRKYRGGPVAEYIARTAAGPHLAEPRVTEPRVTEPRVASESAVEAAAEAIEDRVENPYDEPIHYPPENALPDAPVHELPAEEAEAGAAAPVAEAEATSSVAAEEAAGEAAGEQDEEGDNAPAVAPMLDEDEDLDIQAMILGDVEGIEIEPAGEKGGEGAAGAGAGEAQPESGSAEVRERGVRRLSC